jgi:hypothetical protein
MGASPSPHSACASQQPPRTLVTRCVHLNRDHSVLLAPPSKDMGVSSLMNDIELACLLLPRGKG